MINISNIRIGDIITKENKYEGYKYSIVEGIDNISGTIRHREVYELQALLDLWKIRDISRVRVKIKP